MSLESTAIVLFDSSGNPVAVLSGDVVGGTNPAIIVAGSDGANARFLKTDTTGRPSVVGAAANGAAAAGNPVLVAGLDTATARSIIVDASGRPIVVGAGVAGTQAGGVLTVQGDPAGTPIPVAATEQKAGSSAVTQVASSIVTGTILAANANRLGATIMNDSTKTLFLKLAAGPASATSYSAKLLAGAYYEVPASYTGIITGLWAAANGFAYVTELTP
jgi:hypothetical protein